MELSCFFGVPDSILSKAGGMESGIVVCGYTGYFMESNMDKLCHF